MRHLRTVMVFAGVTLAWVLGMAASGAGSAQTPPREAKSPVGPPNAETLAKDQVVVDAAVDALNKAGLLALKDHLPALEQVLADAPKPFEKTQILNGRLIYRTNNPAECLIVLGTVASRQKTNREPSKSASCMEEPYSRAALLIGSYHNEVGEADAALAALDAGLAVAPDDPKLISEREHRSPCNIGGRMA